MWAGRHVVLGVSGGIASYKSCILARRLTEAGARVDVVLTQGAAEFVRPLTFEALTGRPVLTSLWEPGTALSHLRLAQAADLIIVAPATANLIARVAPDLGDDLLTTLLLARRGAGPPGAGHERRDVRQRSDPGQPGDPQARGVRRRWSRDRGAGGGLLRSAGADERAGDHPGPRRAIAPSRRDS